VLVEPDEDADLVNVGAAQREPGSQACRGCRSSMISEDIQVLITARLSNEGIELHRARRGEEGLALAYQDPPDVVLLDLDLPDANGLCVCRELKKKSGEELVVILRDPHSTEARSAAERILRVIAGLELKTRGALVHVTASIGLSSASPDRPELDAHTLVAGAHEALYQAKAAARDRVVSYLPTQLVTA
jgi:PleD family two-component response regulator